MKKVLILGLALALMGGVAYANYCARDYVPAATLLVPYAVVDLNADGTTNPAGYTTLLAVTNVSSASTLIHVTVWSPRSNAVVDFDEALSGYDVWTINFRDLLNGRFDLFDTDLNSFWGKALQGPPVQSFGPSTNGAGGASGVTYELPGPWDTGEGPLAPDTAACQFPYGNLASLGSVITGNILKDIWVGGVEEATPCVGSAINTSTKPVVPPYLVGLGKAPAFFYVTVDNVTACSTKFPNDTTYWTSGIPLNYNQLIGDIIYLNASANYSESIPAVSIEASTPLVGAQFYDRYTTLDTREPLGTAYAFRYLDSGGVNSQVMIWKNEHETWQSAGGTYYYGACAPYIYFAWDENENSKTQGGGPSGFGALEPNLFPYETQSVPLDPSNFTGLMANNGWMLVVFDPSIPKALYAGTNYTPVTHLQAWAGVRYLLAGYSTSLEAATMANVWCFPNQVLPPAGSLDIYGLLP